MLTAERIHLQNFYKCNCERRSQFFTILWTAFTIFHNCERTRHSPAVVVVVDSVVVEAVVVLCVVVVEVVVVEAVVVVEVVVVDCVVVEVVVVDAVVVTGVVVAIVVVANSVVVVSASENDDILPAKAAAKSTKIFIPLFLESLSY